MSKPGLSSVLTVTGLLAFLVLSLGLSYTRAPWWDEGFMAGPSASLASGGPLGSHVLSSFIPAADRYLYWNMPAYFIVLAVWFKAFGSGIFAMRAMSIAWGFVVLGAWYVIMMRLVNQRLAAALMVLLLAGDWVFVAGAANGRMDMMTAALGFCGLAVYLTYREQRLDRAVLLGACGAAGAAFCHPMGLIYVGIWVLTVLYLDWRRIRIRHVLLTAVPFLVLGGLWGLYISQSPQLFTAQMQFATSKRIHAIWNPIELVSREITGRYLMFYSNPVTANPALGKGTQFKILGLIPYIAGFLMALSSRRLRSVPGGRVLIGFLPVAALLLAIGDPIQFPHYFLHVFPFALALLAAACSDYWIRGQARLPILALLGFTILIDLGGLAAKMRANTFATLYTPAVNAIRPFVTPDILINGPCELIFAFGDAHVYDGMTPEQYAVHRPEFIVLGRSFGYAKVTEPERYELTYRNSEYEVYREKGSR